MSDFNWASYLTFSDFGRFHRFLPAEHILMSDFRSTVILILDLMSFSDHCASPRYNRDAKTSAEPKLS